MRSVCDRVDVRRGVFYRIRDLQAAIKPSVYNTVDSYLLLGIFRRVDHVYFWVNYGVSNGDGR